MADVHDKATRSYNMIRIKGKDTKAEMVVRQYLHIKGLLHRLHKKTLPGEPDLNLSKYHTIIFVNRFFLVQHKGGKYFV